MYHLGKNFMNYYIKGDYMKNKSGFTLVEIISVIVLLGIVVGITVPTVMITSNNIKKKTLETKIDNIEKAAVLYGQKNRNKFNKTSCTFCSGMTDEYECYCFDEVITVGKLATEKFIKYDDDLSTNIMNSISEVDMKSCEIQIYKKYGKIYAVYLARDTEDNVCWYK